MLVAHRDLTQIADFLFASTITKLATTPRTAPANNATTTIKEIGPDTVPK